MPELLKEKCLRCGHEWIKRIEGRPVSCPMCKSPYHDKPRKPIKIH